MFFSFPFWWWEWHLWCEYFIISFPLRFLDFTTTSCVSLMRQLIMGLERAQIEVLVMCRHCAGHGDIWSAVINSAVECPERPKLSHVCVCHDACQSVHGLHQFSCTVPRGKTELSHVSMLIVLASYFMACIMWLVHLEYLKKTGTLHMCLLNVLASYWMACIMGVIDSRYGKSFGLFHVSAALCWPVALWIKTHHSRYSHLVPWREVHHHL